MFRSSKINYIIKKIYNKYEVFNLNRYKILNGLYLLNKNRKHIRTILFYFPDYTMMHYGDHLFYEPLASGLKKLGYIVYVYPIKAMEFYFKMQGFDIGSESMCGKVDLIVSKVEFITCLYKTNKQVLFTDTTISSSKLPLCRELINNVYTFLGEDYTDCRDKPSNIYVKSKNVDDMLENDQKYILFNNYVDSGFFRIGRKQKISINNCVNQLKSDSKYKVIHTGSQSDKDGDYTNYEFVDVDIRGMTSIEQMFYLASKVNIIYNVSYDAFQMHLFLINMKKSFVVLRGRLTRKNDTYIRDYVIPPFLYSGNKSDIVEFIN